MVVLTQYDNILSAVFVGSISLCRALARRLIGLTSSGKLLEELLAIH
jgi:hypothetical protein